MRSIRASVLNNGVLVLKASIILLVVLSVYYPDLGILMNEALNDELMSYLLAVPFLLAYLIYRKRSMLRAVISFNTPGSKRGLIQSHEVAGGLLCVLAVLLYWYGSYTFTPLEYHLISLPIFVSGVSLVLFNFSTLKVLFFPIAFLLFLVPLPLEVFYAVGATLSVLGSEAAYMILKGVGLPVALSLQYNTPVIELTKIGVSNLVFDVGVACSGLYSLTGFIIFAVFIAYIARGSYFRKSLMFVVGFPVIYSLNILRIVIIVLIGAYSSMEAAMQAFHLLGGSVLIFLGALVILTVSEKILKLNFFTLKNLEQDCSYCSKSLETGQPFCESCGKIFNIIKTRFSIRDVSKIAVLALAAILIVSLQMPVFALTKGPAQINMQTMGGGMQIASQILPQIQGYSVRFLYRDLAFEGISGQDASLAYAYSPDNNSQLAVSTSVEVAKTILSLHRWEVCLITWPVSQGDQSSVVQYDLRDVQLLQNPSITARFFAFQYKESGVFQIVLYWFTSAPFVSSSGQQEQKQVKISLIAYTNSREEIPGIEEQLLPMAKSIADFWQPVATWSQIILIISQNGFTLVVITIALLVAFIAYQAVNERKKMVENSRLYNKINSDEDKTILDAVHQAAEKDKSTINTIALHYQKISGKSIEPSRLLQTLKDVEKVGLIKSEIISIEDKPFLIWKPIYK